jgi:hypothetical protein
MDTPNYFLMHLTLNDWTSIPKCRKPILYNKCDKYTMYTKYHETTFLKKLYIILNFKKHAHLILNTSI